MSLRAVHRGPSLPARFISFRVVEDYRTVGVRARSRGAAELRVGAPGRAARRAGPRRFPGAALPQRPPQRELHRRRRADPDRRLGVRRHGRRLLRPRELLRQPRARPRASDERSSRPTSARFGRDDERALELMLFMSDFREAMWGVVQGAVSELDFDFAALRRGALRADGGDGGLTRVRQRARAVSPLARSWIRSCGSAIARKIPEAGAVASCRS